MSRVDYCNKVVVVAVVVVVNAVNFNNFKSKTRAFRTFFRYGVAWESLEAYENHAEEKMSQ